MKMLKLNAAEILFQNIGKEFHKKVSPEFGQYYTAEFDNIQQVIRFNGTLESVRTYEETNTNFKGIDFARMVIISDPKHYSIELFDKVKGEQVILLSMSFMSEKIIK